MCLFEQVENAISEIDYNAIVADMLIDNPSAILYQKIIHHKAFSESIEEILFSSLESVDCFLCKGEGESDKYFFYNLMKSVDRRFKKILIDRLQPEIYI